MSNIATVNYFISFQYTCVGTQTPCPGNGEKGKISLDNFLKEKKINGNYGHLKCKTTNFIQIKLLTF